MEKGLKTHNPTDNADNNSLKRSANQTLTRHRDSEGFRRQTQDTCLLRSGVRRSSGLGCRSTSYFRHPPPPPKYWFCFCWKKSAEADSPLMTTCFQESPSCYGGRLTASPPAQLCRLWPSTQESSRRPTLVPHPCSPFYPPVHMSRLLQNFPSCGAAPGCPSACPGCCHDLVTLEGLPIVSSPLCPLELLPLYLTFVSILILIP